MTSVEYREAISIVDDLLRERDKPKSYYARLNQLKGLVNRQEMEIKDFREQMALIEILGYQDNG